ncbi:hypothetical protein AAF712_007704 [Marasmius tenuissimus]|uniref:Uncharacterized protein n=1 Tax=Marasmius tenuissimus TaxID=585030 RepID=A0ABR2ZYH1_9AGAR
MDLFRSQKPDMSFWDATDKNWAALRVFRVGSPPNQVVVVDFMKARDEDWSVNTRTQDKDSWQHTEFINPVGENLAILRLFMLGRVNMNYLSANLHDAQSEQEQQHDQGTSDPADDLRHYMTLKISEVGNGSSQGISIRFEPGMMNSIPHSYALGYRSLTAFLANTADRWSVNMDSRDASVRYRRRHLKAGFRVFTTKSIAMQLKFGLSDGRLMSVS